MIAVIIITIVIISSSSIVFVTVFNIITLIISIMSVMAEVIDLYICTTIRIVFALNKMKIMIILLL